MYPRIPEGSYVIIIPLVNFFISKKSIFCFKHKRFGKLIKNFEKKDSNGFYWFKSENSDGVSIKEIGPIKKNDIIGKVIFIIRPY